MTDDVDELPHQEIAQLLNRHMMSLAVDLEKLGVVTEGAVFIMQPEGFSQEDECVPLVSSSLDGGVAETIKLMTIVSELLADSKSLRVTRSESEH